MCDLSPKKVNDFLTAQSHLRDSTLPRPLLHRSRGPPTIRNEYVALQTHLAPPPHLIVCTSVAGPVCPSTRPSVVRPVRTSTRQPPQSVIHPPVSPVKRPSDRPSHSDHLYTILPHLSGCPKLSDCISMIYTCLSAHPPPSHCLYDTPISLSACPSPTDCLNVTTTRPPIRLSSPMIHHTQDSIHSLAVVNGEQSHTIHRTQDSCQSLAVVNGSNPTSPRNSIGPLLTTTYFYVPQMPLASTYMT